MKPRADNRAGTGRLVLLSLSTLPSIEREKKRRHQLAFAPARQGGKVIFVAEVRTLGTRLQTLNLDELMWEATDSFLLFSDVNRLGHKLQGYSNSFPDADDAKIQKLQILSDITGEVETRAGIEIRAQAEQIQAQAKLIRAQAEEIRAQVELTRAQAKESQAVREEGKAKDQNKVQAIESQDKAKGDCDKQKSQGEPRPRRFWDKSCLS